MKCFERENILTPSTLLAPSTVIFLKLFFPKKLAPSFRKKNAAVLKDTKSVDHILLIDTTLIEALNLEEITNYLNKLPNEEL